MDDDDRGFGIYVQRFERGEMARVADDLIQSSILRSRAGARHVLRVPAVRRLATDARLVQMASRLLGRDAFPVRATLFDKSFASNWLVGWHQDTALPIVRRSDRPGWGPWTTKAGTLHAIAPASALEQVIALRVHLDDSAADNGPLRVLPGTHSGGVLNRETIRHLARAVPPFDCVTTTGGVIAMRPLIVHASSKARIDRPRRVIHIEYAGTVRLDSDIELAVD